MLRSYSIRFVARVVLVAFAFCQVASATADTACIVSPTLSTATSAAGVLIVCPQGDGDQLSAQGLAITVTVKDCGSQPIPTIPTTDMWAEGCSGGLSLCSHALPFVSGTTNQNGVIVLDGRLIAGGCDNSGLRIVVMGITIQSCVPIQARSMDLKSSGANACGGDQLCPDGKVNLADFAFFNTHYPTAKNPGATYFACMDFTVPYGGALGLADYAQFAAHLTSPVHGCS
jgi:hypothetical protein